MTIPLPEAAEAVLLDFDGPVCSVFAGHPAPGVADELRALIRAGGAQLTPAIRATGDPLQVLRLAHRQHPGLVPDLDDALTRAEVLAVRTACGTPGAAEFLDACESAGRRVVIVSNNSRSAVEAYLRDRRLLSGVDAVFGRPRHRPELMKPHPIMVEAALDHLQVRPESAVLIGDSITDVQVARHCRVPSIGLANRPQKISSLTRAGADLTIRSMAELDPARRRWSMLSGWADASRRDPNSPTTTDRETGCPPRCR